MILYAGSYTQEVGPGLSGTGKGIYCFKFNTETGNLKLIHSFENRNTSYLTISKNQEFLYSFEEVRVDENPVILAFKINKDFSLKKINSAEIKGGLPCHLNLLSSTTLAISCYQYGTIHLFSINKDGSLNKAHQDIEHNGRSVNIERQECAHAHMICVENNQVYVPDLGIDAVINYSIDNIGSLIQLKENNSIQMPLGIGPRHMVFHPEGEFAFVIGELTGDVVVLKMNKNKFNIVETINSLPNGYNKTPSAAAIAISPDGLFLYVSNRGSNTLAIFKFNKLTQNLNLVKQQDTLGNTPREFSISPDGKWLIVANQDSNNLVVFSRNIETGELRNVEVNTEVNSVVCLKWL